MPSRPAPTATAIVLWGDAARTAEGLRARSAARRRALRRLRPPRPVAGRASSATSPARRRPTSNRRVSATHSRGSASGGRSVASASTTAGRSPASCRWRSPTSSPNRSRPTRSRPPSRGVASSTPRWGRGRPGTTAVLLIDAAGNDGGAAGQTVFVRGGPGALATALAAAATAAGVEIRTGAEVAHITSRDGRATGVVAGRWRGADRPGRRRRHRPEARPDRPRRPGRDRTEPALAGGQHPDARHGRQGQPRAVRRCRGSRRPATTRGSLRGRIVIATGIDAMERAHDAAKFGRLPERADARGDDPVARGPVADRRRGARHARHERHRPGRRRTRSAARPGTTQREASRRPRRRDARRATRPAWPGSSPRARSSPRSTSSATTA